jgi:microsomal dipeptidase-like Zn-dependent dipeptidase
LKLLAGFIGLVLVTLGVLRYGVLPYYDQKHNAVLVQGPYVTSATTRSFHQAAFIADLHADPLLWGRDLRQRYNRGQVDLPRLRDGGVDLQVFSVVSDVSALLFIASLRSPATWFSPREQALAQAKELRQLAASSPLTLVLRREDLSADGLRGLLALEGMHALEGEAKALDEFHAAGFRMMGLAHFADNQVAGSTHGVDKYGLTKLGRLLVPRMEALGITIDLAHASPPAFRDTLELATRPMVVSHGGVNGTCPGPRNLTNTQLRSIARNGGVVGIGYWKTAVCDVSVRGIVNAIQHAIKIAGVDHVGLGSDFDGHVTTPFDTTGLPMLTESLLATGLSEEDVKKVLGGNVQRVLAANLPE